MFFLILFMLRRMLDIYYLCSYYSSCLFYILKTSGDYYASSMDVARQKIQSLISLADAETNVPKSLDDISGEWELVFTTVKHGIFRSSPFFLAVQEAFEYGEEKEAFGEDKATLFFKLHELQTCSVS